MDYKEQIEKITELLNELSLADLTLQEYNDLFLKQSIEEIKDELWRMYCFAEDICNVLNNGGC